MSSLISRTRMGFRASSLNQRSEPHALRFLSERTSFWLASLSILAFITGNMVGQHGWYAFWASVLGGEDETLVVYTGTVTPVAYVPDYSRWMQYGGDQSSHTYRQVPQDLLVPLPSYDARSVSQQGGVYSVGHAGNYTSGEELTGSHPGIDIRAPEGTPVRAVMNGIVTRAEEDIGFGKFVVLKHPNVPDPASPGRVTTLYSVYAHLSSTFVSVGSVIDKSETIGLSGSTGYTTGPHVHFQIDRKEARYHPYWPFTVDEIRAAGLTFDAAVNSGFHKERILEFTVHPMLYIQANYAAPVLIAKGSDPGTAPRSRSSLTAFERLARANARREERVQSRRTRVERVGIFARASQVIHRETVVSTAETRVEPAQGVARVEVRHDGSFTGREWERVRVTLYDAEGNVVRVPALSSDIALRTVYGDAEFRPAVLSSIDFEGGVATVNVLPRGRRTVVFQPYPFPQMSEPMEYEAK